MLENTLELPNNTLGCSSSSIELSPKETLSSSSSTSSRSGSLYNFKSKIKRLRRENLKKKYLKTKFKRFGQAKLGFLKAKRYASLSSASSTSSSVSSSPNNLLIQSEEKQPHTKKPMKLHKFYHSVPFKCPFCFTFKEIPQDFIDHLTSVHFSDVKLLYERKCTKLIESGENQIDEVGVTTNLAEIPSKLRKMIKDLENEEEIEIKENAVVSDKKNEDCMDNETKNLDKEQEIHTPPKTPPSENKESVESPKSSYLSMNSAILPPRKQQRLLKSPFDVEENQKPIKSLPFSVPALLSDHQHTKTNYNSLNMSGHQVAQNQEASMKCAVCDRGFEYYSNLRRHIKTKHKIFGKQVKEYVIRQNAKKSDSDQYYKNFIDSSAKTVSPVSLNPVLKKQKNENDESFDDDIDESQAELASSTSTTSSFSTHSSNAANMYAANQANPALMAAAALSAHFPAHLINHQQMMAFLSHSSTMNKLKSSLLESLLNRKMPEHDEHKDDAKANQFSKLIQNIVEMNQFSQFNNASNLAAMNQATKVKCESLEENENLSHETDLKKEHEADFYDEDNLAKKEEDIEYEENEADNENKVDGDDLDNDNDDMQSRTSSSRSFHSDGQSSHLTPPSVNQNKFMFNNPLGGQVHPPQINQFVLETHLRNLTQQNFSHQAYQAYQQNLHRFNLANQPFLNPGPVGLLNQQQQQQSINQLQSNSSASAVPGTARRKKSKDLSTSSMVQSMRNLQCSPSNQQNADQNIRFSSEIWRCPYCCYETTSASRYNSHLVCHGWKPYLCPHCGSRSNRLPDMRTHISTFHPEFNVNTFVVLSEEEAKSTLKDYMKNRALINRKLKEMRPQPKFKCKLCPYASLYQFNLTKHVKSVHLSDVYHNNAATPTPSQNQNASQDS